MFEIKRKETMAEGTVVLHEILAPRIAKKAKPGQFVILKATETGERIPLTMADVDPEAGTVTIIFMVVGKSTALFATLDPGDGYQDMIGPLGKATDIEKVGHVVCVGGGTGVAVLHPIARALKKVGNRMTTILGARSKDLLILEDRMRSFSDAVTIMTDDGSAGEKGFVTDALKAVLENDAPALVVAIGPVPMMKAVSELTRPYGIHTVVSLNPIMIDGTGMCGGCRVSIGGKTKFACVDGPEFDGHAVDFDNLSQRLRAYRATEEAAMKDHVCNMEKAR